MTSARVFIALATAVLAALFVLPLVTPFDPRLIYNPTASAPRGWYTVRPIHRVRVGDFVIVRLPETIASLADSRGYLPSNVPLLKRVGATAGQWVCATSGVLRIDGAVVGSVRVTDHAGRRLPLWSGCRVLRNDELFLLSTNSSSFDSRYFGPLPLSALLGAAIPLWVW
jgi:conjugative transfer signal peptidase TraF